MNEHLRYSSEPRSRSLTLPALVSEETMLRALFNYYGSSMPLSDGTRFTISIGLTYPGVENLILLLLIL